MRLKVFTLFLALQAVSFGIHCTMSKSQTVVAAPAPTSIPATHNAANFTSQALPDFSVKNLSNLTADSVNGAETRALSAMAKLPVGHTASVKNVI
ncbi:hypothetical protein JXA05_03425, partial [Candidatus Peregrinibacteria bacterium]|nr:hypothetical protein [Candidatus Peregrinibacteria bacterium]